MVRKKEIRKNEANETSSAALFKLRQAFSPTCLKKNKIEILIRRTYCGFPWQFSLRAKTDVWTDWKPTYRVRIGRHLLLLVGSEAVGSEAPNGVSAPTSRSSGAISTTVSTSTLWDSSIAGPSLRSSEALWLILPSTRWRWTSWWLGTMTLDSIWTTSRSGRTLGSHRTTVLWEVRRRGLWRVLRSVWLLRRISVVLASWGTILTPLKFCQYYLIMSAVENKYTYATLQRPSIHVVPWELADCHCSILMSVHLDKRKSSVCLKPSLDNVTKVLEQWNKVILGCVRCKITDINGCLPLRRLLDNHVIALNAMGREMVMTIGSSRSHSHSSHSGLLRDRGLALLVSPVAADRTRTKPFSIHTAQSLLGVSALTESDETVTAGAASLHIPHNAGLRNWAKSREGLGKDFIIDLVGKVTDEDMEVVSSVFLARLVGLICPVDTNFLILFVRRIFTIGGVGVIQPGGSFFHSELPWHAQPHQDHRIQWSHSCTPYSE